MGFPWFCHGFPRLSYGPHTLYPQVFPASLSQLETATQPSLSGNSPGPRRSGIRHVYTGIQYTVYNYSHIFLYILLYMYNVMSCGFYFYNINVVSLIPIHYIYIYIHYINTYIFVQVGAVWQDSPKLWQSNLQNMFSTVGLFSPARLRKKSLDFPWWNVSGDG